MENRELLLRAKQGDREARDALVRENYGLIGMIAKKFVGRGLEKEDIFQIGSIGLLKAIDRFNLSFDVKFSTYAVPMILGEIKRFFRDDGMIKVSRQRKEQAAKVQLARDKLLKKLGREPGIEELGKEVDLEPEVVTEVLELQARTANIVSLYGENQDGDRRNLLEYSDIAMGKPSEAEQTINRVALLDGLEHIDACERKLIQLRYYECKTQVEVAKMLKISQVQVSRIEKRILKKLREYIR